jgi:hypothetical protein
MRNSSLLPTKSGATGRTYRTNAANALQSTLAATQATSLNDGVDVSFEPKRRIIGNNTVGAEIITGVLVHQTRFRTATNCATKFAKLTIACLAHQGGLLMRGPLSPYGTEPAFNPRRPQYSTRLEGKYGAYFNATEGSGEVSSTGFPYAFFPREIRGAGVVLQGFPVVFEVRCRLRCQPEVLLLGCDCATVMGTPCDGPERESHFDRSGMPTHKQIGQNTTNSNLSTTHCRPQQLLQR